MRTLIAMAVLVSTVNAQDAQGILRSHCYQCHGTNRDDWDASNSQSIQDMGQAILDKVESDQMPPGKLPKLSEAEKATLRAWFNAPHEQFPTASQVRDDAWVGSQIANDASKRGDSLYVSLANLRLSGQQLWDAQGAVSKAANLLSTAREIAVPAKVDKAGIVLRLDVTKLGWTDAELIALLAEYPYSDPGYIRGDWFVARGLAAPLYYRLLGIPGTQRELDSTLGIDRQRFIGRNLVKRAAITDSRVAFHNRAIEWSPSNTGAVRLTYDTANETGNRRIVSSPLAFTHDATEYIADLPNGLHLYAVFNAQGQRQNRVAENIASDPSQYSGSTTIVPGISCASCHKTGIQSPANDVVRDGAPLFDISELARVQSLYPPRQQFAALLKRDESRYLTAVHKATEPFKSVEEPIGALALEYNKPVTLEKAAIESNTTPQRVRSAILASADLQTLGLRPLAEGQTVTRETFESLESGTSPAQRISQLLGR